jgi:hypothetical protein
MDPDKIVLWTSVGLSILLLFERSVSILNGWRGGKGTVQKNNVDFAKGLQEITDKAVEDYSQIVEKMTQQKREHELALAAQDAKYELAMAAQDAKHQLAIDAQNAKIAGLQEIITQFEDDWLLEVLIGGKPKRVKSTKIDSIKQPPPKV